VTDFVNHIFDCRTVLRPEAYRAATVIVTFEHFSVKHMPTPAKGHPRAWLQLLAGMHQGIPLPFGFVIRQQQALDGAATRYAGTEQARGKYLRVIDDEQVAVPEELGELSHTRVFHATRVSMEDEEFRRSALGRGGLRDQFRRQIEPEVRNVHRFLLCGEAVSCALGVAHEMLTRRKFRLTLF
jgi:hypothetical protein